MVDSVITFQLIIINNNSVCNDTSYVISSTDKSDSFLFFICVPKMLIR